MAEVTHARVRPAFVTVLRAQVETVALARRWVLALLGGLILLLFVGEGYAAWVRGVEDVNPLVVLGGSGIGLQGASIIMLLVVVWALSVWHQEAPSRRLYHWSMPVERGAHDRIRVLAGGLWLVAGVAALLVGTAVMALLTGNGAGIRELPSTVWLNHLTGAVTVYLLAVIPGLRSEHPFAWIVGAYFGVQALPILLDWLLRLDGTILGAWTAFLEGPVGPVRALSGGITDGAWGQPAWGAWLPSALVWLALAVAGVYAATWRSPDA